VEPAPGQPAEAGATGVGQSDDPYAHDELARTGPDERGQHHLVEERERERRSEDQAGELWSGGRMGMRPGQ
jgi:hypothetical protein